MPTFIQLSTTVDRRKLADKIANDLLKRELASCVQIYGPVKSYYRWKGRLEHAREWLCLVKARSTDYHRIETRIKELHPYEVPEIIAFPIVKGSSEYLHWIYAETFRKS